MSNNDDSSGKVFAVHIRLPNGAHVLLGPMKNVSQSARLVSILGGGATVEDIALVRAVLCVRAIDRRQVPDVTGKPEFVRLCDRLGDDGLQILQEAVRRFFPWTEAKFDEACVLKVSRRELHSQVG